MGDVKTELHNKLAGEVVASIVRPILGGGGATEDVMVLTESVLVGVALVCIKLGGDNLVLEVMFERAKRRLAELRLTEIEPAGRG